MQKIGDNISLEQREDVCIIYIKNNLSYQTADELREGYNQIQHEKILIDLSQIRVTTSRGMATLLNVMLESYDKGWRVCLYNVADMFMNIIEVTEIMKHVPNLKIVETLDEGMEYLRNV